jgi:hypothetical protein
MEMVSMGVTPSAFSISERHVLASHHEHLGQLLTSKTVQAELIYPSQGVIILPVVLDDVDVV